ncbi:DEAD/DEAH box helicase family protein [Pseudomonadales bacterium]|nr:DEAD/DEAH box helicase family protein [Pseudomonadales bacterium]
MALNDIELPSSITTGYEDPVNDFFVPTLKESIIFDVAVGYFTSGWLRDAAEGIAEFAINGGKSRWVISPELNEEDAKRILEARAPYSHLKIPSERQLFEIIRSLRTDAREELCALIACGVLDFKIAIARVKDRGMLHAKLGVLKDATDNSVAFSGSYNLTSRASSNWEHMDIFRSWEHGENTRIAKIEERFENLWSDGDPRYEVLTPSRLMMEMLEREAGSQLRRFSLFLRADVKEKIKLRYYQDEAIERWGGNNGRGTYVMATGSGKTITALATMDKLIEKVNGRGKALVIVVVLPLKHLLDQWFFEAKEFGFDAIKCYESSEQWKTKLAERLGVLNVTGNGYVMAMVTNATLATDNFQKQLNSIDKDFFFVADEAHNLGSTVYLDCLPGNANFRLALSATPERHNDDSGTEALYKYFGKPVIDFTLKDAINAGFLCEYEYHPHLCLLSEVEYEEYLELSELIAGEAERSKDNGIRTKEHQRLLGKRADLLTGVDSKLETLEQLLMEQKANSALTHTLVYCGSQRGENNERHIERTVKLAGKLGVKTRKFTADESLEERREILSLFSTGELEAIAAIKCLDEGVDVPATRVAYILASTTNPREYIQRRGRVLRKSEGKDKAIIHDFLVAPPSRKHREDEMVERELERAAEFADLAINSRHCNKILRRLAIENGVKGWS